MARHSGEASESCANVGHAACRALEVARSPDRVAAAVWRASGSGGDGAATAWLLSAKTSYGKMLESAHQDADEFVADMLTQREVDMNADSSTALSFLVASVARGCAGR